MCSVQDDLDELTNFEDVKISNIPAHSSSLCKKCGEEGSYVLLHRKDPTCRACFEVYCNHKFRSTIGKTKKLKPSDKVLIAYSGGLCSAAMVGLTNQALKDSANKKLRFIPAVIHVDEAFITNSTPVVEHESSVVLKESTWPVFITSLEMALRDTNDVPFYWETNLSNGNPPYGSEELKNVLMKSLSNTKSLSSKLDYLKLLRTQLITDIARHAGFDYVFYGDSCDDLAIELLCDIAMGRGSQVSSDIGFYDARYQVPICRPLREFLKRELVFFNRSHYVPYDVPQNLVTKTDSRMSIQRLTETFVCGLQNNFPSTVHTIFKTGGKVSSVSSDTLQSECCIICKSVLDNKHPDLCSALELLSVSSRISQNKETKESQCHNSEALPSSPCCCESKASMERYQNCTSHDWDQNVMKYLCHGCQVTMEEMGLSKNLQPELLQKFKKQINRTKMKEEIQEFLLED